MYTLNIMYGDHQQVDINVGVNYELLQDGIFDKSKMQWEFMQELQHKFVQFRAFSLLTYTVTPMLYDSITFVPKLSVTLDGRLTTIEQAEKLGILTYDVGLHIADTFLIIIEQALKTKQIMEGK